MIKVNNKHQNDVMASLAGQDFSKQDSYPYYLQFQETKSPISW